MIHNPNFINLHLRQASYNPEFLLAPDVLTDYFPYTFLVEKKDECVKQTWICSHYIPHDDFSIANSCNGLICLLSSLIWGPIFI